MAEPHKGRFGFEDSLNFTNSLCVAYTLCSAVLRGWIRRDIYGVDDAVIAAATVTTLGHFIANYVALNHGAGKPWSYIDTANDLVSFEQASMASIVLFTMSLYLSKCSVVAFLLRLTKDRRQILFYRACLVFPGAVGLASILIVTAGWPLDAGRYWASASDASACTVQSSRWAAWTALDITTELLLLILPINMAWKLQMPLRKKLAILSAFYMRVPTIAISIGRLVYTRRLCKQNSDLGLDTALVLIWICIEASYALLASHFLALRALTLSFNSGFGFGFTINAGPESYSMQQRSRTGNKSRSGGGTQDVAQAKPGLTTSSAEVRDSGSSSREASTMSIMRETEYSVQYQDMTDEAPILSRA